MILLPILVFLHRYLYVQLFTNNHINIKTLLLPVTRKLKYMAKLLSILTLTKYFNLIKIGEVFLIK